MQLTYRFLSIGDEHVPYVLHGRLKIRGGIKLVPVQLRNYLRQMGLQMLAAVLGDAGEPERRPLLRVPDGVVVRQVHELIDQVRLVQVGRQRTQLFVSRQVSTLNKCCNFLNYLNESQNNNLKHVKVLTPWVPSLAVLLRTIWCRYQLEPPASFLTTADPPKHSKALRISSYRTPNTAPSKQHLVRYLPKKPKVAIQLHVALLPTVIFTEQVHKSVLKSFQATFDGLTVSAIL